MMAPKAADGQWIQPLIPGSQEDLPVKAILQNVIRWIYTWHVQHDVQGLINLMGGRQNFIAKLNALL